MDVKELTQKKGKFTKAEKKWLLEEGAKWGVEPPTNENCPDCWRDMAVRIAVAMRPVKAGRKGVRLRGMAAVNGVLFCGRIITNDTLDDETLEWMKEKGFPKQLLTDED